MNEPVGSVNDEENPAPNAINELITSSSSKAELSDTSDHVSDGGSPPMASHNDAVVKLDGSSLSLSEKTTQLVSHEEESDEPNNSTGTCDGVMGQHVIECSDSEDLLSKDATSNSAGRVTVNSSVIEKQSDSKFESVERFAQSNEAETDKGDFVGDEKKMSPNVDTEPVEPLKDPGIRSSKKVVKSGKILHQESQSDEIRKGSSQGESLTDENQEINLEVQEKHSSQEPLTTKVQEKDASQELHTTKVQVKDSPQELQTTKVQAKDNPQELQTTKVQAKDNPQELQTTKVQAKDNPQELQTTKVQAKDTAQELQTQKVHVTNSPQQTQKKSNVALHRQEAPLIHEKTSDGGATLSELRAEVVRLQRELTESSERFSAHDASSKKTIMSLQNDMRGRLDNLSRHCEENRREKEAMVLKYAEAERKTMEVQKRVRDLEGRLREAMREREGLAKQARVMRQEKDRMQTQFEAKCGEVAAVEKELLQSKDSVSSVDMKVKWHQNKLKEEMDKHKEAKRKLEEVQKALRNAKEETETIRTNCQQIVRQYQESEEMRSNSLDAQLKQKENELKQTQAENYVQQEVHQKALKDLESFRKQAREATAELRTLRDKVKCLEAERMCQEETAAQAKERAGRMKLQRDQLAERLRALEAGAAEAAERAVELEKLRAEATVAQESRVELEAEVERARGRESELLEFTQRLSDRNAALQAETLSQRGRLEELSAEVAASADALQTSQAAGGETERQLTAAREALEAEVARLSQALAEKTRSAEELSVMLADEQNEIRTLKKKHAANTKDLSRQLAAAQRKIDARHSPLAGLTLNAAGEAAPAAPVAPAPQLGSNGEGLNHTTSPASSISSLDLQSGVQGATAVCVDASEAMLDPTLSATPEIKMIMPDRQALIDKIVRLQRQSARHNEKMDFLQEHIAQLTEQLKKKNRLLQHFILREEAGSVTPEDFDLNKAALARKGGIMASVYSTHASDQGMTLDLSLEITKKLQAVLEDTLLKNITLKDNLNTLGEEISRLSRQNRQLQLNEKPPT